MELTYSLSDINTIANKIIEEAKNKVILFNAEMGAGKTTLIKAILKNLGVQDSTSSPTFSLVNEYKIKDNQLVYHFDLYRLNDEEEAYDFGIEEYLYSDNWCFIEWPEKAPNLMPQNHSVVTIEIEPNLTRKLTFKHQ